MRLIKAFFHSMSGLRAAFQSEAAFRLEVYLLIPALILLMCIPLKNLEYLILLLSYSLVMICELLNTALEKTIDRISLDPHDLSKKVKDMASAAVFIASLICAIVWGGILMPKLLVLL